MKKMLHEKYVHDTIMKEPVVILHGFWLLNHIKTTIRSSTIPTVNGPRAGFESRGQYHGPRAGSDTRICRGCNIVQLRNYGSTTVNICVVFVSSTVLERHGMLKVRFA
nr:PREDICTED: uncharacterized protein LOC108214025 [Daucus carota subsp. sativus]